MMSVGAMEDEKRRFIANLKTQFFVSSFFFFWETKNNYEQQTFGNPSQQTTHLHLCRRSQKYFFQLLVAIGTNLLPFPQCTTSSYKSDDL
jgi:hypothetical protein